MIAIISADWHFWAQTVMYISSLLKLDSCIEVTSKSCARSFLNSFLHLGLSFKSAHNLYIHGPPPYKTVPLPFLFLRTPISEEVLSWRYRQARTWKICQLLMLNWRHCEIMMSKLVSILARSAFNRRKTDIFIILCYL